MFHLRKPLPTSIFFCFLFFLFCVNWGSDPELKLKLKSNNTLNRAAATATCLHGKLEPIYTLKLLIAQRSKSEFEITQNERK